MTNLILFGPPGSGKGTQAAFLIEKYGLVHISTGDLFRYEMNHDTPLGQEAKAYMANGELVPDSVTIGMLRNKVEKHSRTKGFIFDGFPRTIPHAEALDALLFSKSTDVAGLISLEVGEEEIVQRILLRRTVQRQVRPTLHRRDDQIHASIFAPCDKISSPKFQA